MGNEVDEDLIEATIRRVAEARAAQSSVPAESSEGHAEPESSDAPEDAIEATIRRVAEAKAAQLVAAEASPSGDEGDAVEDPIHAIAPDSGDTATQLASEARPSGDEVDGDLDDHIEATVRRVAEARAAQLAAVDGSSGEARDTGEADHAIEATIRRVADAKAAQIAAGGFHRDSPAPADAVAAAPHHATITEIRGEDVGPASLEEQLAATNQRLDAVASRVDTLLDAIQALTEGRKPSPFDAFDPKSPAAPADDEDWDDSPQIPRVSFDGPPRPAVLRDPSPMTATAQHLVESDTEGRPAPRAVPTPLDSARRLDIPRPAATATPAPEQKRGFDLLPKTYRITVEDKRRGVDLVPLHRALLGMEGVKDMSLLSYSNGVAIVSVETQNGIEPDALNKAVARAMARDVQVEVHNDTTMVVKLAED